MPPRSMRYTEDDFRSALQDVDSGTSINAAAKRWDIPPTTLYRHYGPRNPRGPTNATRPTPTQEEALLEWARAQCAAGNDPTLEGIRQQGQEIMKKDGNEAPPSANYPKTLRQRYPEIAPPAPAARQPPFGRKRLTNEQEAILREWAQAQANSGTPPSFSKIQERAQKIMREAGDTRPLNAMWARMFVQRNPDLPIQRREAGPRLDQHQEGVLVEWLTEQCSIRSPPPSLQDIWERAQGILSEAGGEASRRPQVGEELLGTASRGGQAMGNGVF